MKKFLFAYLILFSAFAVNASESSHKTPVKLDCELIPMIRNKDSSAPRIAMPNESSYSTNWSGYAAATNMSKPKNKSVKAVEGTWIVPSVSATMIDAYSAIWVGIDGFTSQTVEQIGTEQNWIGGEAEYYAWYEMYPNSSYQLSNFPVSPGDTITAKVSYVSKNTFQLEIHNITENVYTIIPKSLTKSSTAQRSSAEWIVEAPATLNSGILPLANFGIVKFSNCTTIINDKKEKIESADWQNEQLTMSSEYYLKATTSSLSKKGGNFSVTWHAE
jgi:hypothetical protein